MVKIRNQEAFRRLTFEGVTAALSQNLGMEGMAVALLDFAKQHLEANEHVEIERIQKEEPDTFDLILGNMLVDDMEKTTKWLQVVLSPKKD